ncbi:CRISPR-associated protein Cas4 [Acidilobus sp.]|uniref:CRISPR-associated protein Cas4 n=1 Tax=Acidilobus sp. TaxID=1872109 RepID=UPI003CFF551C
MTASDVKQFAYCPLIPWINRRLGVAEAPGERMKAGRGVRAVDIASKLGLPRPWREGVSVRDDRLMVRGTVDLMAGERGNAHVLEVKAFRRSYERSHHFRAQLLVYSLLAERALGGVRAAHLYLGGDLVSFPVTLSALREAEELVKMTWEAVESESPPPAQRSAKCAYCWYRHVCPAWD